ncbi:PepSY domain-containing protein [Peribacillus simplex]|uniref:PepSY domain-containing protein n=2 Tax=Peribacillus TaxID=2675229 RepID=A0AA90PJ49_9BACI|nr:MULTISPECIES: PepSY domain-containing protein [Peribacillus]MDP1420505.1 PepSY domain-containing protein [Peribacillus simplex]MDP1453370.1 PepSY domain-containing protein [Peribacillus frigoritolerans]
MKIRKVLITAGSTLVFGLLLFVGFQWWAPSLSAESLTKEEVNQTAKDKYPGTIIKTTKNEGEEYQIEMQLETGVYQITMDAKSGEVRSIKKETIHAAEKTTKKTPKQLTQKEIKARISSQGELEQIDFVQEKDNAYYKAVVNKNNEKITLILDPYTGTIIDSTMVADSIITENEAIAIAEKHVKGTGDDTEFYQPSDQTPYYLVEVELEDDRDAVVQVDGYTKEVKTITWEDDEENDNDGPE